MGFLVTVAQTKTNWSFLYELEWAMEMDEKGRKLTDLKEEKEKF